MYHIIFPANSLVTIPLPSGVLPSILLFRKSLIHPCHRLYDALLLKREFRSLLFAVGGRKKIKRLRPYGAFQLLSAVRSFQAVSHSLMASRIFRFLQIFHGQYVVSLNQCILPQNLIFRQQLLNNYVTIISIPHFLTAENPKFKHYCSFLSSAAA